MSTRDINKIIGEMYAINVDATLVSRITDKLLPEIESWQNRPLEKTYALLFIDGIRFKVKEEGRMVEKSVYIVIGVNMDGLKDVLGFWIGGSESAKYWLSVFNDMKSRGMEDVLICSSDNLKGISEVLLAAFPNVRIQKCIVHQIRNSMKHIRYDDAKEFANDLKSIYRAANLNLAEQALDNLDKKWGHKYAYAIKSWRSNFSELVTFFEFPTEIRRLIYTTNIIENLNRNIRKITKTKGMFPNEASFSKILFLSVLD